MVSVKEAKKIVSEREQELSKVETQARQVVKQKIPERKFGAAVTPQQQRAIIQQRKRGRKILQQAKQERQAIQQVRTKIRQAEQQRAGRPAELRAFKAARKLFLQAQSSPSESARVQIAIKQEAPKVRKFFKQLERENAQAIESRLRQQAQADIPVGAVGSTTTGFLVNVPQSETRAALGLPAKTIEVVPQSTPQGARFVEVQRAVEIEPKKTRFEIAEEALSRDIQKIATPKRVEAIAEAATPGSTELIGLPSFVPRTETSRQVTKGLVKGTVGRVVERPLAVGTAAASGFVLGAGLKIGGFALTRAGAAVGGIRGAQIARGVGVGGGTIGGTILTGDIISQINKDLKEASTLEGKAEVIGKSVTDFAAFGFGAKGGSRVGEKAVGRLRTIGAQELSKDFQKNVFDLQAEARGKAFPEIRRGETPQQLRERFFTPKLPSETGRAPRAFTASDIEFPSQEQIPAGKVIKTKGKKTIKSEFAGRFGADVVSENFLRLKKQAGESATKSFGIDPFGSEPTITRSTLKRIDIAPDISPTESRPTLSKARIKRLGRFFGGRKGQSISEIDRLIPEAEKGVGTIPFTKRERELIITKGSEFKFRRRKFFVKVEGVRVPIVEKISADVIQKPGRRTPQRDVGQRIRDFAGKSSEISSSVARGSRGAAITPSSSIALSVSKSIASLSKSLSKTVSNISRSISARPTTSKITVPFRPATRSATPPSRPFRPARRPRITSTSRSILRDISRPATRPPTKIPGLIPQLERGKIEKLKRKKRQRQGLFLTSDLTSRVAGFTKALSKAEARRRARTTDLGFGLRPVPVVR